MLEPVKCSCPKCGRPTEISATTSSDKGIYCPDCKETLPAQASGLANRSFDTPKSSSAGADGEPCTAVSETAAYDPNLTQDPVASSAQAIPTPLSVKIGRFEIRGELGEGAFGKVYEAYDSQLDRTVALKVAKLDRGDSAHRIKRFLREAKTAANLRHPHIVPLYEYGQDGGQFYIASAFIQGKTLADDLERRKKLNLQRAARLVRQISEALAYAHSQGIVHRDVKPANTMLDEHDEPLERI